MKDLTGEFQEAGSEHLELTLEILLDELPLLALLQIDAFIAFDNVSHERVSRRVQAVPPSLLRWTARLAHASSKTCGSLDQVDPMSPFLFALGLPVRGIQERVWSVRHRSRTVMLIPGIAAQVGQVVSE